MPKAIEVEAIQASMLLSIGKVPITNVVDIECFTRNTPEYQLILIRVRDRMMILQRQQQSLGQRVKIGKL